MQSTHNSITIAVDAMGGDHGPSVTVAAAIDFLKNPIINKPHKIILVGLEAPIMQAIEHNNGAYLCQSGALEVVVASEVVAMDEPPAQALKKKKDSSMRVAINQVKEGKADAAVSAGNTGALMATARFVLKTIRGIDRPAICAMMPVLNPAQVTHMLDLGANIDSSPEMLMQFAIMGSVLSESVDHVAKPRIGLLNVGAEDIKGSEKVKKTSALLAASSKLNYVGYVEADEIYDGRVDVIVCDGFEGNIALKASEGTANMVFSVLKEEFQRGLFDKLVGLFAISAFKRIHQRLDPRRLNGASLLGLNGIVIKSHGGTDAFGFLHAIEEASKSADLAVNELIKDKVLDISS